MNALTIDIRPAEPADAAGIAGVHEAAWTNAYAGLIPHKALNRMVGRRGAEWWRRAIRSATSVIVIDIGGEIVGYATLGLNRARALPQDGEIYELYIQPEYQGVGLGSRLFSAARRILAEHGCKGLVVWALEENHNACGFYAGQGGRDVAEGAETFDDRTLRKVAFAWE